MTNGEINWNEQGMKDGNSIGTDLAELASTKDLARASTSKSVDDITGLSAPGRGGVRQNSTS